MFSLDRKNINILIKECMLRRQHVACEEQKKRATLKKLQKEKNKVIQI